MNDIEWVKKCVAEGDTDGCCFSFGNLFTWGDAYSLEIAEFEGLCLIRGKDPAGGIFYTFPSGKGDIKKAISAMMDEARENNTKFVLYHILENNIETLNNLFPDVFKFIYDRDTSEYVYSVKNMAELPGKKFHGKKGHVNAFFRNHENVCCDPITDDNIHLCLDIAEAWRSEREDSDGELENEFIALEKAVNNFKALGYIGAILYADDLPVAFTMGEPLKNNTFCTHFEKTVPDCRDAFPVINNGFTKLMLNSYDYVNREEDTGLEGLRKAKLSYYPEFLLNKYTAVLKNDPTRKFYADVSDYDELKSLWKNIFGDSDEVTDFFFRHTVKPENIFVYRKDDKIVASFYLIDSQLVSGNKNIPVKYLYAAATLPMYREQGIMSSMISEVSQILKSEGVYAVALYPANDSLYDFYNKLGFKAQFNEKYYKFSKEDISEYSGKRYFNSSLDYYQLRESIPSENYVSLSHEFLDFARFCAKNGGFDINAVFDDEDKVFVIGRKEDSVVIIDEAISSDGNYNHIFSVLADIDCDSFVLKTPVCISLDNFDFEIKTAGMLLSLTEEISDIKDIYLGQPCM